MKTLLMTFLVLLLSVNLITENPPESIVKALKQKFPSAVNIKWEKKKYYDWWEASFNLRDKKATASFALDGRWVQSTLEITDMELLDEVKLAVKKDHPGCEILSAIITERFGLGTWYRVKIKCGDKLTESDYDNRGWPWPPKIT
jgi:hypothetical protein